MKSQGMLRIIAFGLPLLVFGLWVAQLEWQKSKAKRLEVAIEGYDPRDLISGHFLRYRLVLGGMDPCKSPGLGRTDALCLCWTQEEVAARATWSGACDAVPASCSLKMRGQCGPFGFEAGIERAYIPEADAEFLKTVPPGSRVVLSLTKDGQSFVEELKPEGMAYQEWIRKKRE